jgi:hypothetical protein
MDLQEKIELSKQFALEEKEIISIDDFSEKEFIIVKFVWKNRMHTTNIRKDLTMKINKVNKSASASAPTASVSNSLINKLKKLSPTASAPTASAPTASAPMHTMDILNSISKFQGKLSESLDMSINKFQSIETMQKDILETKNLFASFVSAYEKIISEQNTFLIKIYNEVRKDSIINKKLAPTASAPTASAPTASAPTASAPNSNLTSDYIFQVFMKHFPNNFLGTREINSESIKAFEEIIEALPETNDISEIDKSIRLAWGNRKKQGKDLYFAAKSMSIACQALINTLLECNLISTSAPTASAPTASAPTASAPIKIYDHASLARILGLTPLEFKEYLVEIRSNKARLSAYETLLTDHYKENGISELDGKSITSAIFRMAIGK